VGFIGRLHQHVQKLLTDPLEQMGRGARFLRYQVDLWRFCFHRLRRNNAMAMSAALSFRTIFAVVPALVLAFLVIKSMGVLDKRVLLRRVMDEAGLSQLTYTRHGPGERQPTSSQPASSTAAAPEEPRQVSVAGRIESLVNRVEGQLTVGRLGPVGTALMIWTALTLLMTMERSLNRIFEAPRARPLLRRVFLYWTVLTLGPLLLVVAIYAGRWGAGALETMPVLSELVAVAGWAGSVLVGILLLMILYSQLPNTHVPLRHALAGAVITIPLWLVARWGFSVYMGKVAGKSLYGALGLLPLFLLWLNLSWWLFLFGAQVAQAIGNLPRGRGGEEQRARGLGPWQLLGALAAVAQGQRSEDTPQRVDRIARVLQLPVGTTQQLLDLLAERGVLARVAGREPTQFVLARPAENIRVAELLAPDELEGGPRAHGSQSSVVRALGRVRTRTRQAVGELTLDQVLSDSGPAEGS